MLSDTLGAQASGGGNVASVSYCATYSPVTITLGGTTKGQVLTGQQVSATLNAGGLTVVPNSTSWSASGGKDNAGNAIAADIFKDYQDQATSNQLVPLSSADVVGPSFAFYTKKAQNITVTCNTIVSTNTNPVQSFAVTPTKLFYSAKPTADTPAPSKTWKIG